MNKSILSFLCEEDGVTALEYGILAALVAATLIATFKTGLADVFNDVIDALKKQVTSAAA